MEKDFSWCGDGLERGSVFVFKVAVAVVSGRAHVFFPVGEAIRSCLGFGLMYLRNDGVYDGLSLRGCSRGGAGRRSSSGVMLLRIKEMSC